MLSRPSEPAKLPRREQSDYVCAAVPVASADRMLSVCRVALAVGGLVAEYLDPSQPSAGDFGYIFLVAYVVFAFLSVVAAYRAPLIGRWAMAAHGLEIGLIALIIIYTEGPTSPFFIYFSFLLLAAVLKWQWKGALITGSVLSVFLIGTTASQLLVEFQKSDVDRLIVRNVYLIVATLLFAFLGNQLAHNGRIGERFRTAQELHDGILQTLTALGLKITMLSGTTTGEIRTALLEIGRIVSAEHRNLRGFVSEARAGVGQDSAPKSGVRLRQLKTEADRLQQLWDCNIAFEAEAESTVVPASVARTINLIMAEGVANAVLHGRATEVCVSLVPSDGLIGMRIQDNGLGLPDVAGCYDHDQITRTKLGPQSIRRRTEMLGGSIHLESSEKGLLIEVALPLGAARLG